MKKVLLTVLAMGLLSTGAMAVDGKVGKIKFDGKDGAMQFTIMKSDGESGSFPVVAPTPEIQKSLTAAVLTAKAGGFDVSAGRKRIDGIEGWGVFTIK